MSSSNSNPSCSAHRFRPWRAAPGGAVGAASLKRQSPGHSVVALANIPTRLKALATGAPTPAVAIIPVVPTRFTSQQSGSDVELGVDYQVQRQDVLYGALQQGSVTNSAMHSGNLRLRVLSQLRLARYLACTSEQKRRIVQEVVEAVKESGGSFIKFEGGTWYQVGDAKAMEMTSTLFRCLSLREQGAARRRSAPSASAKTSAAAAAALSVRRLSCPEEMRRQLLQAVNEDESSSSSNDNMGPPPARNIMPTLMGRESPFHLDMTKLFGQSGLPTPLPVRF